MPRLWDTKYVNSPAFTHKSRRRRRRRELCCDQHNKRGDATVRLVGTTNSQQIEVMEIVLGD